MPAWWHVLADHREREALRGEVTGETRAQPKKAKLQSEEFFVQACDVMRLIYAYLPHIFGQSNNRGSTTTTGQTTARKTTTARPTTTGVTTMRTPTTTWRTRRTSCRAAKRVVGLLHSTMQIESIQCNFSLKPEMNTAGNEGEEGSERELWRLRVSLNYGLP